MFYPEPRRSHSASHSRQATVYGSAGTPAAIHALLADAAAHYRLNLHSASRAIKYLHARGITGAAAARFGLGFAGIARNDLAPVCQAFDAETVEASGLRVPGDAANAAYDRFRARIMLPIRDRAGAVVGFGGRVIEDADAPKYLNSPESPVFKKRSLLYGLYEAQESISAQGMAVVVEGYLDVISLAQSGHPNVVGTLGTACTETQVRELLSITQHVVFCFDGDAAGRRASVRAMETALPMADDGQRFEFVLLPTEHDPDSFVRAHGAQAFDQALARASPLALYMIDQVSEGLRLEHAEGRAQALTRAKRYYDLLADGTIRSLLLDHCAKISGLAVEDVLAVWQIPD